MKKLFVLGAALLLLSGCFDSDFNFKTVVKSNGSIERETKIAGRGADRFVAPSGKGWQVKKYETKSGQSVLEDKYYHIDATGKLANAADMGSDYLFNSEKQFEDVSDEERQNFIKLGITEPFSQNIYSKNFVQLVKYPGLFKSKFEYQEMFQNKGIIELLLNDLKKEVIREQNVSLPAKGLPKKMEAELKEGESNIADEVEKKAEEVLPPKAPQVTIEGQLLSSQVVEQVAKERLKNEILSRFHYRSEVVMPGRIVSANAGSIIGSTAVWQFALSDFELNYSRYVLTVKSEMIEWKRIVLIVVIVLVGLFGLSFVKTSNPKKTKR